MRLLVLADIHSNAEMLEKALEEAKGKFEYVILLGDSTHYGGKQDIETLLKKINSKRIIAIPGNIDSKEVIEVFEEKGISLHQKKKKIEDFCFIGFGGGKQGVGEITFSEEEIFDGLEKLCKGEKNIILLTHTPPFDTKIDFTRGGIQIGSKSIRKIIEKYTPLLNLCGHCHEAMGEDKIGKTMCINAGAVKDGNALIVEIGKTKEIKLERIRVSL